jgi:hypothetical protein
MSKQLKWGKMAIQYALLPSDDTDLTWLNMLTPVQDSFAFNVEDGEKLEAFIEGGERVAVRRDNSKYSFEFDVHVGSNAKPIADDDGIISGEYALRVIPENTSLPGFLMPRCSVSVQETFTSKEGHKVKYTFEALKPETGKMLEEYTVPVEPGG